MLPVLERGVLQEVTGVADARAIDGIRDVVITAREGQLIEPQPEDDAYMGFVFAAADTPEALEARYAADQAIAFDLAPLLYDRAATCQSDSQCISQLERLTTEQQAGFVIVTFPSDTSIAAVMA